MSTILNYYLNNDTARKEKALIGQQIAMRRFTYSTFVEGLISGNWTLRTKNKWFCRLGCFHGRKKRNGIYRWDRNHQTILHPIGLVGGLWILTIKLNKCKKRYLNCELEAMIVRSIRKEPIRHHWANLIEVLLLPLSSSCFRWLESISALAPHIFPHLIERKHRRE